VLEAPGPAIICLYAPEVYLPRKRGELLATQGRLVEIGDAISAGHIAALLSQFNKEDQTRDVNDVSFAELRRSPAILIGGSMLLTNAAHTKHHFVIEGQEGSG
jgi:hypothetical protein